MWLVLCEINKRNEVVKSKLTFFSFRQILFRGSEPEGSNFTFSLLISKYKLYFRTLNSKCLVFILKTMRGFQNIVVCHTDHWWEKYSVADKKNITYLTKKHSYNGDWLSGKKCSHFCFHSPHFTLTMIYPTHNYTY